MAVDGVLEIKRRYMHESLEEAHRDTIREDFDFAWMDVLPVEVKEGILYVKNRVFELNTLLQDYKWKTGIPTPTLTPASSTQNISLQPAPALLPIASIKPRMSSQFVPSNSPPRHSQEQILYSNQHLDSSRET